MHCSGNLVSWPAGPITVACVSKIHDMSTSQAWHGQNVLLYRHRQQAGENKRALLKFLPRVASFLLARQESSPTQPLVEPLLLSPH
jgi:hypothetical protein